ARSSTGGPRKSLACIRADFRPAIIGPLRCGGPRISRVGKQRAKSWPACAKVGPRKSALLPARFRAFASRQSESDAHPNRIPDRGSAYAERSQPARAGALLCVARQSALVAPGGGGFSRHVRWRTSATLASSIGVSLSSTLP